MEKTYDHKRYEKKIYKMWKEGGYFKAERDPDKKPYTIILPPPNASGKMHTGNVLMIAIEDLLIRWKRMRGFSALWVPGTDHAGFETQITFERELKKKGKSRFDYDRNTLYQKIWEFVQKNRKQIENQIRNMGASVDWSRYKFTLDDGSINTVVNTFKKLEKDGLVYRDDYMVNYCPSCGTTFADLEVKYKEKKDPLYYIRYPIKDSDEFLIVATVRPETMFGDAAVAVHPDDKRYKKDIGKTVLLPLTKRQIPVIEDKMVDKEFGTGAVKITPAHDPKDFEVAKRHNLETKSVINMEGKMKLSQDVEFRDIRGLKPKGARKKTVEELKNKGFIEKIDKDYKHSILVCYKGGHTIEPTILPNWFIKVNPLKKPAHEAVKKGKVKIYPKWQEKKYHNWMETMHDWPISRQVVWGIRIPAWYSVDGNPDLQINFLSKDGNNVSGRLGKILENFSFEEIEKGLQTLIAPKAAKYKIAKEKPEGKYLQETDTFDTWFSSGQWPLITLGYPNSEDFKYFYPTSVLETAWDILRLWVSRMIMFGIYLTGKPPFKDVYLHGIVRAIDGKKMSKSLGNVINPEEYQEKYGTDALRMGLIAGTAAGKDFNFPHDKVVAYRNFANKIWNMARFINIMSENLEKTITTYTKVDKSRLTKEDKEIVKSFEKIIKSINENLESYRFADAAETIYHFIWDSLASDYLESVKKRKDKEIALSVLRHVFNNSLKLLHPFMPFVTEAIWENLPEQKGNPLIVSSWPQEKN